jgi:hypothetical protein
MVVQDATLIQKTIQTKEEKIDPYLDHVGESNT